MRITCLLVPFAFLVLPGCDQKQQTALEKQTEQAVEVVQNAAGKTASQALRSTSTSAVNGWINTARSARQGGVGLRVKSALALSSRLEGASIDVDLQGNRVVLIGEVLTPTQKAVAVNLAKNIVDPKFRVADQLKIDRPQSRETVKKANVRGY